MSDWGDWELYHVITVDDDDRYEPHAPCPCCFESCGYRGEWTTGWDDPGSFIQSRDPCPECNGSGLIPCDMAEPDDERANDFETEGYERALDAQAVRNESH